MRRYKQATARDARTKETAGEFPAVLSFNFTERWCAKGSHLLTVLVPGDIVDVQRAWALPQTGHTEPAVAALIGKVAHIGASR